MKLDLWVMHRWMGMLVKWDLCLNAQRQKAEENEQRTLENIERINAYYTVIREAVGLQKLSYWNTQHHIFLHLCSLVSNIHTPNLILSFIHSTYLSNPYYVQRYILRICKYVRKLPLFIVWSYEGYMQTQQKPISKPKQLWECQRARCAWQLLKSNQHLLENCTHRVFSLHLT